MRKELDFEKQYPCPCGEGTYLYQSYSDDWNRGSTYYTLECENCKEKYARISSSTYKHTFNHWVLKDDLKHYKLAKDELDNVTEKFRKELFELIIEEWEAEIKKIKNRDELLSYVKRVFGKYAIYGNSFSKNKFIGRLVGAKGKDLAIRSLHLVLQNVSIQGFITCFNPKNEKVYAVVKEQEKYAKKVSELEVIMKKNGIAF